METLARYFGGDAATVIRMAAAQGVRVRLVDGGLRASGQVEARNQWLPPLQRFRDELLAVLRAADETRSN